jgi:hypothetical protein
MRYRPRLGAIRDRAIAVAAWPRRRAVAHPRTCTTTRDGRRRRALNTVPSLFAVGVLAMTSAACGSSTSTASVATAGGSTSAVPRTTTPSSATPTKCCVVGPSRHLRLRVTPVLGPPGTSVRITATGCDDPAGDNHAVSFNNNADDPAARNDPGTVHVVPASQRGSTLRATYRITQRDKTNGAGRFYVQCGQTMRSAAFRVT